MAEKLAEEQKHKVGWEFDRYNGEFVQPAHTVGCAYLPNNKKVVVPQGSNAVGWGFHPNKNTSALNEAKTRMNSAFSGEGGI